LRFNFLFLSKTPLSTCRGLPCLSLILLVTVHNTSQSIYLTALQEEYDALPDFIGENNDMINFEKAKRMAALLSQVHKFQSKQFSSLVVSPRAAVVLHQCIDSLESYERFVDKVIELQAAEAGDVANRRATMSMIHRETGFTGSGAPASAAATARFNRTGSFKVPAAPPPLLDLPKIEDDLAAVMVSNVTSVRDGISEAAALQESVDESSSALFVNTVPLNESGVKVCVFAVSVFGCGVRFVVVCVC
jgi:hypothetical protein